MPIALLRNLIEELRRDKEELRRRATPASGTSATIRKTLSTAPFENPINTKVGLSLIRHTEIS
jgi:hypothetical protein